MKDEPKVLRPASELNRERNVKAIEVKRSQYETELQAIIEKIEAAHAAGKTQTDFYPPPCVAVRSTLHDRGYKVLVDPVPGAIAVITWE